MARDYYKQHMASIPVGNPGIRVDHGYGAFTTTGAEVEIYTTLTKIYSYCIQPVYAAADTDPTAGANEHLWLDEAHGSVDGAITVSGHAVTLRRAGELYCFPTLLNEDAFAADDLVECVLFTAPCALTLTSAVFVNSDIGTWGGSPVLSIGYSEDNDPDDYVNAQAITGTKLATTTITTFVATAVTAATDVRAITTGGTTDSPAGSCLTVNATGALTSGLAFSYMFFGID